jgi:hypothetical protein
VVFFIIMLGNIFTDAFKSNLPLFRRRVRKREYEAFLYNIRQQNRNRQILDTWKVTTPEKSPSAQPHYEPTTQLSSDVTS